MFTKPRMPGYLWTLLTLFALAFSLLPAPAANAATITVDILSDENDGSCSDGDCSLRDAILIANDSPGADTIVFDIAPVGCTDGICTISPSSCLPALSGGETTIDGYSQPGAEPATELVEADIRIKIDGSGAIGCNGLAITSASNEIRGLAIVLFDGVGINLQGSAASDNLIAGNYIGTDVDGLTALANDLGIYLILDANNNIIGGDTPEERNVISGNKGSGVSLTAAQYNRVSGNYIGVDASGKATLGNYLAGVSIGDGSSGNEIGGSRPGEGNVISGNSVGVEIHMTGTTENVVRGNTIGADASGMIPLGDQISGVVITDGASSNTIGGSALGERNIIFGNSNNGVVISMDGSDQNRMIGNYIGVNANRKTALSPSFVGVGIQYGASGNRVIGGVIAHNELYGVHISGSTTTGNIVSESRIYAHTGKGIELDNGANGGVETPDIESITKEGETFIIQGRACANCIVELFASSDDDGEGEAYLGSTQATAAGDYSYSVAWLPHPYLTATAQDAALGTSEFSYVFESPYRFMFLPLNMK